MEWAKESSNHGYLDAEDIEIKEWFSVWSSAA